MSSSVDCASFSRNESPIIPPKATTFLDKNKKAALYFIKDNPWQFDVDANMHQKIFRFCIACGEDRFSDKDWKSGNLNMAREGKPPTICSKDPCWTAVDVLPDFVPRRYYVVESEADRSIAAAYQKGQVLLEQVSSVSKQTRPDDPNDKVFASRVAIPRQYRRTLEALERIPVESRIAKIDALYFAHRNLHNSHIGVLMSNTKDPYLKALASYREKCFGILERIRK